MRLDVVRMSGAVETVKADIVGPLAVHPTIDGSGWTVTHRRSRFAVVEGVTSREEALVLAHDLRPLNWKYSAPARDVDPPNTAAVTEVMASHGWKRSRNGRGPFVKATT